MISWTKWFLFSGAIRNIFKSPVATEGEHSPSHSGKSLLRDVAFVSLAKYWFIFWFIHSNDLKWLVWSKLWAKKSKAEPLSHGLGSRTTSWRSRLGWTSPARPLGWASWWTWWTWLGTWSGWCRICAGGSSRYQDGQCFANVLSGHPTLSSGSRSAGLEWDWLSMHSQEHSLCHQNGRSNWLRAKRELVSRHGGVYVMSCPQG